MTRWAAEVRSRRPRSPSIPGRRWPGTSWANLNGLWDYAIAAKEAGRPEGLGRGNPRALRRRVGPVRRRQARRRGQGPLVQADRRRPQGLARRPRPPAFRRGRLGEHSLDQRPARPAPIAAATIPSHYDITDGPQAGREAGDRPPGPTTRRTKHNSGIARGKQVMKPRGIFYTAVTGIWQTVWLEPVPDSPSTGLKMTPDIDRATLTVDWRFGRRRPRDDDRR
ncbi:MAG: hypothetical protein M0C28_27350 [Candidatus Moduliflexus flocculans]|nr:hypothetical protein [Candidatus Moduliflexus flocculans]